MATGNPNQDKLVHFIAKVRDTDGQFKPIYTPLDATDRVYGNVLLSDEVDYPAQDEDKNCAATGVRAATPKAVKSVAAIANNKLDKHTPFPQTVQGIVEFKSPLTFDRGATVSKGEYITGDLKGNATTADKLKKAINLSTKSGTLSPSGSVLFDGSKDVTIPLGDLDATKLKGLVPLDSIPQGALERVYNADSIDDAIQKYNDASANEKPFQEGDTVRITSVTPPVMYVVVGNPGLKKNYVEYAAGTATRAYEADQALKLTTDAGSDTKPVYFKDGVPVESKGNVGTTVKPIYVNNGELTALFDTIGNTNKPVYMKDGSITALDYEINKSVPADAVFTDTTYDVFAADVDGLVPAPTEDEAANEQLFLKSDGTWGELIGGSVTGVKGDTEYEYRTKDVNLTYENIGAIGLYDPSYNWESTDSETKPASKQSMKALSPNVEDKIYTTEGGLMPGAATTNLGSITEPFNEIYANTFDGQLLGNATTATTANRLNSTLTLNGNVSGSVSLNSDGNHTLTTTIANNTITLAKLASDVGTVAVQSTQPSDSNVKLWIKI